MINVYFTNQSKFHIYSKPFKHKGLEGHKGLNFVSFVPLVFKESMF